MRPTTWASGFTLAEILLGGMVLTVAMAAILGAYLGQVTLNAHARNLTLAVNDANRVIEQIRQNNINCGGAPSAAWPAGSASWDDWLANAGGGKILVTQTGSSELVTVTCQDRNATASFACDAPPVGTDPIRVTVAICWRHRNRVVGECTWNTGTSTLLADESVVVPGDSSAIDSPAMVTTLVTCR